MTTRLIVFVLGSIPSACRPPTLAEDGAACGSTADCRSASCAGGSCGPSECRPGAPLVALSFGPHAATSIALSSREIFWATRSVVDPGSAIGDLSSTLWRAPRTGGDAIVVTTSLEPIGGIVADDGGAFWPGWVEENSWYELWTAPSGLGWGFTTGTRAIFGSALAVQPAAVFVGNPVGRFDRATGRGTAAFSDTPMAVGIAADATSVYWLAVGGGIYRASTEDPQHGEILTRTSPGAGLALRGGFLYWFTNVDDRTEIVRVSTRGGTPEALLQWDGDARIVNLVATEHWIIFSRKFPSTDATLVQRIPRNGGELPTTIVAGDLGPGAFAASETCVFYTQRDGSLIRAPIEQMP